MIAYHNKSFQKFDDAFNSKKGICYIDGENHTYTYNDFFRPVLNEESAAEIYQKIQGESIETYLQKPWDFVQCKRCRHWIKEEESIFNRREKVTVCPFCTPVRTYGRIKLWRDPYEDDRKFYKTRTAKFETGITTISGCNGIGKTTLLNNIVSELKQKGVPYLLFDNLGNNGGEKSSTFYLERALGGYGTDEDIPKEEILGYAMSLFTASEGEKISSALAVFARKIIREANRFSGYGEFWVLFDAVDSGLSADIIEIFKTFVLQDVMRHLPDTMNCYILLSSNSYEMSENTKVFFVHKMKYCQAKSYKRFKQYILESAKYKDERDHVLKIKADIRSIPYTFSWNEELEKQVNSYAASYDGILATLTKDGFKLRLLAKSSRGKKTMNLELYKADDKCYTLIPARIHINLDDLRFSYIRKQDVEEQMHSAICAYMYKDKKR